jgi:hypothetical protein
MNNISVLAIVVPAVCLAVAGWPLLFLQGFRQVLLRAGGSCCIGLGTSVFALLASGMATGPFLSAAVMADDQPGEVAEAELTDEATEETTRTLASELTAEAELTIDAPSDTIEIPPGRPEWVGQKPKFEGKVHTIAVASGPYATDKESRRALDAAIVKATNKYIADQVGSDQAPRLIRFDARTIKKRFVKPDNAYHDVARYSVGWMHENFALLEFGPEFRNELDRRWTKVKATSRVAQTGLFSGAVLALVGSIFGYFRLDNATRGYYTRRLQFMAAAAILAVVGFSLFIAGSIHWL